MLEVKFDKKSRKRVHVGTGVCSFCDEKTTVASTKKSQGAICAACFAESEGFEVREAVAAGLGGHIFLRVDAEDLL